MVRSDIWVEIREQVQKCLTNLHLSEQGKKILAGMETVRFISASDKNYDMVSSYVEQFEKKVRKIEKK